MKSQNIQIIKDLQKKLDERTDYEKHLGIQAETLKSTRWGIREQFQNELEGVQ